MASRAERLQRQARKEAEEERTKRNAEEQLRKKAEETAEKAKRLAEELAEEEERRHKFFESSDYSLVEQFVKKYGIRAAEDELSKLQNILSNKQWNFSVNELERLIQDEYGWKSKDFIEKQVFAKTSLTFNEAIRIFLERCNPNDWYLLFNFAFILKEKGFDEVNKIDSTELMSFVENEIKKVEKQIELESFEERLNKENEQVWLEDIDEFNGYEFEEFLTKLFSKMGYKVEQTKLSGDQGADLVIMKFGERTVIQAKRFGGKVGNKAVQEILAAASFYKAQKGIVITNNYFTSSAIELANANSIELIDRDSLKELIKKYW